jgi:hypothetical protein
MAGMVSVAADCEATGTGRLGFVERDCAASGARDFGRRSFA